jgi:dTDP-4-amino-4,6-dideoxygalactose transaminase
LEIRECLEVGWTGAGYKTIEFEALWNQYSGSTNSLFLNSNTSGLEITLQALAKRYDWPKGSEVITSPLTFVSTNHAILKSGLQPIFTDIDESLCLDPNQSLENISKKTVAVMYVGIGGNTGQLKQVSKICRAYNLILILDAAHMAGTKYLDNSVFTDLADVAVYSFQAVKNLPTADAGMISTNSSELHKLLSELSWLGISSSTYERASNLGSYKWMYEVNDLGSKANGNSIMAAIAKVQLRVLDRDNAKRRELSSIYRENLQDLEGIKFPSIFEDIIQSQHLFQIRVPKFKRDNLIGRLNSAQIDVGLHYRLNTHYKMYRDNSFSNPQATLAESEILSLPLHLRLTDENLDRIITTIRGWWKQEIS